MKSPFRFVSRVLAFFACALVAACSNGGGGRSSSSPGYAPSDSVGSTSRAGSESASAIMAPAPKPSGGLGTKWGEDRHSSVYTVQFTRANKSKPTATATVYYNDEAGAREMLGFLPDNATRDPIRVGNGLATIALRDHGSNLPYVFYGSRQVVLGKKGQRYSIVIQNNSNARMEAVLTVDGLDVMDGRPGSLGKSGYVVNPGAELVVEGFRQSLDQVAAFRFSPVDQSYVVRKSGSDKNVGVIGLALFHEKGSTPTFPRQTGRWNADPFPGSGGFATPPR